MNSEQTFFKSIATPDPARRKWKRCILCSALLHPSWLRADGSIEAVHHGILPSGHPILPLHSSPESRRGSPVPTSSPRGKAGVARRRTASGRRRHSPTFSAASSTSPRRPGTADHLRAGSEILGISRHGAGTTGLGSPASPCRLRAAAATADGKPWASEQREEGAKPIFWLRVFLQIFGSRLLIAIQIRGFYEKNKIYIYINPLGSKLGGFVKIFGSLIAIHFWGLSEKYHGRLLPFLSPAADR